MELDIYSTIEASSPLRTFRKILERNGISIDLIDPYALATKEFIKIANAADVVIFQNYGTLSNFLLERLAIVNILGTPLVRNWAGTDALNAISDRENEFWTVKANSFIDKNLTTTHDGIVQELHSLGLNCALLPQLIEAWPDESQANTFIPNSVLAYIPSGREQFYGVHFVEAMIRKFPNINFIIVADNNHSLAHYANVKSLGWVEDFDEIWNRIGLLIRITEHDGFPRMIIEAMARGKYVIHNRYYNGVWFANNSDSCEESLKKYVDKKQVNEEGISAMNELKRSGAEAQFIKLLSSLRPSKLKKVKASFFLMKRIACRRFVNEY